MQHLFLLKCFAWLKNASGNLPCLTSRTSPGGLFSHRPKQWLPLAHRMVVFSGETRPSPPATRSTSNCCCWSVKAHSRSSPCAAVKTQREFESLLRSRKKNRTKLCSQNRKLNGCMMRRKRIKVSLCKQWAGVRRENSSKVSKNNASFTVLSLVELYEFHFHTFNMQILDENKH